jgi:hypothetical protein
MIYCFDLDGTLCSNTDGEYREAKPYMDRINKVNKLYADNNTIIIETARGSTTFINWFEETSNQLDQWGLKYHILRTGTKFKADIYVDDKGTNSEIFFKSI